MDYGYIDVLRTSNGLPAVITSLGVTYKTIWGRLQDVRTIFGDVLKTSLGRNFAEWLAPVLRIIQKIPENYCSC